MSYTSLEGGPERIRVCVCAELFSCTLLQGVRCPLFAKFHGIDLIIRVHFDIGFLGEA